jgi:6-phosphogluconolactonase
MVMRTRILLILAIALVQIVLTGCNEHSGCHDGFGNTNCTGSSGGGGGNLGPGGGGGAGSVIAYAYAVDQTKGTIDGYSLTSSSFAALSGVTAPTIPTGDPGVGMVVVKEKFVYAVFDSTDTIEGWSIDSGTGALTALTPVSFSVTIPTSVYNRYNVITDPSGSFLFLSNTLSSQIWMFSIDGSSGALTEVATVTTPMEPGNLTTDGLGKFLYVCGVGGAHTGGTVILAYNITTTGLTAVTGSPFTLSTAFPMWQLAGESSGQFLIGTSGNSFAVTGVDDNHLYVFSIAQTGANTGAISVASGSPYTTSFSPLTITAQPTSSAGEFVYAFSLNDAGTAYNPIQGFSLDPTTGVLTTLSTPSGGISAGAWGQFDQSGANLFVYSALDTGSGFVTQLAPLAVDSSGNLTEPNSPVTLASSGYWVVTDP